VMHLALRFSQTTDNALCGARPGVGIIDSASGGGLAEAAESGASYTNDMATVKHTWARMACRARVEPVVPAHVRHDAARRTVRWPVPVHPRDWPLLWHRLVSLRSDRATAVP